MPENRLELVITAIDETAAATASARANFLSIEEEAARMAASANASIDSMERRLALLGTTGGERVVVERSLEMQRLRGAEAEQLTQLGDQYTKLYNIQQQGHVRALERRAELAGKTNSERIAIERDIALHKTETDNLLQSYAQNAERIAAATAVINRPLSRGSAGQFLPRSQDDREAIAAARNDLEAAYSARGQLKSLLSTQGAAGDVTEAGLAARQAAAYEKLHSQAQSVEAAAAARTAGAAAQAREAEIAALEDRGRRASLPRAQYYREEMQAMLARVGGTETAAKRIRDSYASLIKDAEEFDKHAGAHSQALKRGFLALKDAGEGYSRGAVIELVDIFTGTGGSTGLLQDIGPKIEEITGFSRLGVLALGGLAAAFVGVELVGVKAMHDVAEAGREISNISQRTGLPITQVQGFQFAGEASGVGRDAVQRLTRGLSQLADDDSSAGKRGREELSRLGVNLKDQFGDLRPTQEIILEIADAINKLPPGLQRSAASMELFKRLGVEFVPFLKDLRENLKTSDDIGHVFTQADAELAEHLEHNIRALGEQWKRVKLEFEEPLAIVALVTVRAVDYVADLFFNKPKEFGEYLANSLLIPQPGPPERPTVNATGENIGAPNADYAQKLIERTNADIRIRAFQASLGRKGELDQAEEALKALRPLQFGVTKGPAVEAYINAYNRVAQLKAATGSGGVSPEDLVAKDRARLDEQYANLQLQSEERRIRAGLSKNEVTTPEDLLKLLQLADTQVDAETKKRIAERRGKPGFDAFAAGENALQPERTRNAYAEVLNKDAIEFDKYIQGQKDKQFKGYQDQWEQRQKFATAQRLDEERADKQHADQFFATQEASAKQERDLAIQNLGIVDAQTIQQKIQLEETKLQIEKEYAQQSLAIEINKINSDTTRIVGEKQREAFDKGYHPGDTVYDQAGAEEASAAIDKIQALKDAAARKDQIDTQAVANNKTKLLIDENRKVFNAIKGDTDKFYDALFDHSKNLGDVLKNILKSAIETPIKEILSNQTANLLTELFTGQKGSFAPIGSGQGQLGPLGNVLGRLGLGPRVLGNEVPASVNLPGHLGEVRHINGAVPVVILNASGTSSGGGNPISGFGFPSLAAGGLGIPSLLPGAAAAKESVDSSISFGGEVSQLLSPNGFPVLGEQLASAAGDLSGILSGNAYSDQPYNPTGTTYGAQKVINDLVTGIPSAPAFLTSLGLGPGGTSGFAGPVGGRGAGGGILGQILGGSGGKGGIGGLLANLKGSFYSPNDIPLGEGAATTSAGISDSLGGGLFGSAAGGLAGFANSSGAAALGLGLALDGIRRGGVAGTLEATAGGAEVGFKFGGPLGALIGGAAGAAAGIIKSVFFESDRSHTKKLVKQIYGMDINDSTADAIIQIAKQKYGGAISIAVRSQDVRDLLKLYAETLGDKKAKDQFVGDTVHGASLIESQGRLQQQAIYDNGEAYAYASPLSTYGGVETSPLSTSARDSGTVTIGSLQVLANGQSASDLLAGQVSRVSTPGFIQSRALSASNASIGRTQQRSLTLSPSALDR